MQCVRDGVLMYGGVNGFLFLKSTDKRKKAVYKAYSNTALGDAHSLISRYHFSLPLFLSVHTHGNTKKANPDLLTTALLFCIIREKRIPLF